MPREWFGSGGAMLSRFRYTGQIALPELALYHYKARVHDPGLGRFLQTDPVGYTADLDLYSYVANDPLNRVDPTGLESATVAIGCLGPCGTGPSAEQTQAFTDFALDSLPITGEIRAGADFAQNPSWGSGLVVVASLIDLGGVAREARGIIRNAIEGARRERQVAADLARENPAAHIQNQSMLRDANGRVVRADGRGRRIDHVVIENGRARPYETTGPNVNKDAQLAHEQNVRDAGGTYVRDRRTGQLCPVTGLSEVRRCP